MAENYGKASSDALARANDVSEVAIFWGLILTVLIVVLAMIKSISW